MKNEGLGMSKNLGSFLTVEGELKDRRRGPESAGSPSVLQPAFDRPQKRMVFFMALQALIFM